MFLSILAGIAIALGGMIYLQVGGAIGAFLFSVGLMAVLHFKMNLFTGKAGLLLTNEIKPLALCGVWLGNLIGAAAGAGLYISTPLGIANLSKAQAIVALRVSNGPVANFILGLFCGILMYIAVEGTKHSNLVLITNLPVMAFILAGFNHCVADMFYTFYGATKFTDFLPLIPTTLGNLLGCNMIPGFLILQQSICVERVRKRKKGTLFSKSDS